VVVERTRQGAKEGSNRFPIVVFHRGIEGLLHDPISWNDARIVAAHQGDDFRLGLGLARKPVFPSSMPLAGTKVAKGEAFRRRVCS